MRSQLFALAAVGALLCGCTTTVTFTSDIEGATVTTADGRVYGITPVSVQFSNDALDSTRDIDGCARIMGVTYKWPSGASVSSPNPIILCGDSISYVLKFDRPSSAPDLEKDLQNSRSFFMSFPPNLSQVRCRPGRPPWTRPPFGRGCP